MVRVLTNGPFLLSCGFLSRGFGDTKFLCTDSVAGLYFYKQVVIYITALGLALPSPLGDRKIKAKGFSPLQPILIFLYTLTTVFYSQGDE